LPDDAQVCTACHQRLAERVSKAATETTRYETRLHWRKLVPALCMVVASAIVTVMPLGGFSDRAAAALGLAEPGQSTVIREALHGGALVLFVMASLTVVAHAVSVTTARLTITDWRVILETGAFGTRLFEIPLDRFEAVTMSQSMLGRLLDYGTVEIAGTGGTNEVVRFLAHPNEFCRHLMEESQAQRRVA
jgi:uncharacterized membrane protein YdbT with pleckstrin-like domain